MADYILMANDHVNFLPAFPPALVVVKPGQLQGAASNVRINGKNVCIAGDEKKVMVPACLYTAPPFVLPGTGSEKIALLAPNQKTLKVRCNGKAMLLKGGQFQAEYKVTSPAQIPPAPPAPSTPDPTPQYMGSGLFVSSNHSVRAL